MSYKKKRKKSSPLKKLQKEGEQAWKDACHKRDGERCMVWEYYPDAGLTHTDIFQVDHCFSRENKNLFLEVANGTVVCSSCNMLKGFGQKSVARLIDDIVKEREGEAKFLEMRAIDLEKKPCENWKNMVWLENKIKELKGLTK